MESRKFAMNYGASLGLLLVFFALLFWVLGLDGLGDKQSIIPSILNNLLIIFFITYSIIQFRDKFHEGLISYSLSLKIGTTVAFFSSLIMAFYLSLIHI